MKYKTIPIPEDYFNTLNRKRMMQQAKLEKRITWEKYLKENLR